MYTYNNGNCTVTLHSDGTKIREYEGVPMPLFPESMDVKITNYCDAGCAYCHERSTTNGIHGDLELGLRVLRGLPKGVEIAIGGGNPLAHPEVIPFLKELRKRDLVPNITVNQFHLKEYTEVIKQLVTEQLMFGLGISYRPVRLEELDPFMMENTVLHLIVGVHSYTELARIRERWPKAKVLLLGYKEFGRGEQYYQKLSRRIQERIYGWYTQLPHFFRTGLTISFDNLAITQLHARRFFTSEQWEQWYMGDDGTFTMYIDLVEKKYAVSSIAQNRWNIDDKTIKQIFSQIRSIS